ncbi:tumor necrosis factor receptor superfamily member 5 [Pungitius pungitius]|uniref:tumor necrosis factor receptor superfamily member 5 n=1 Tax=Pungitius pungitius TaxID=134920 RepID=UPI001886FF8E|nr:tumor necrosis factor receptor superfamily member 5 [Pungitius pungitius]
MSRFQGRVRRKIFTGMTCSEDKYLVNGTCCDRCVAGQYMVAKCDLKHETKCAECGRDRFTATTNHLDKCQVCKKCNSINNQEKAKDCTAQEDTVCKCVTGYYCSNEQCDHCQLLTKCPLGEGVKVHATRTNDTACAPCPDGTYSNVTDYYSPCQTHTRCEDFGRVVKTQGTPTTDAICGDFQSYCSWILPTGLWSGLLLTALILFGLICWRSKQKKKTKTFLQQPFKSAGVDSRVAVPLVEVVPAAPVTQLESLLPFTELNGHCLDSCDVEDCKPPLSNSDDGTVVYDAEERVESSPPTSPLKASVSFTDSNHINGSAGDCTGNFRRTYSEPQEDEWCGT